MIVHAIINENMITNVGVMIFLLKYSSHVFINSKNRHMFRNM